MIGKLKGIIDEIGEDSLILDVGGVGYHIFASSRLLATLGNQGAPLALFIETHMREDAIRLYGFATKAEQEWFRLLQHVQGVGAKVALALLGTLSAVEIADAITLADVAILTRAPGVGKKVAERMITELKGKAASITVTSFDNATMGGATMGGNPALMPSAAADAVSALTNLGYSRAQATNVVAQALKQLGDDADSSALIRVGLQRMSGV